MKKLKFPEVFHTHINLSGRSEIFGGFKKICLRCIYFHATVSSSLPSWCSSLTPTSDQCKRAPPKNISSPIWKSEGIRLGWVLKRFLSVAFLSASPRSSVIETKRGWTTIETDEWLGSRLHYWTQAFLVFSHRRYHHAVSHFAPFYQQASSAWGLE